MKIQPTNNYNQTFKGTLLRTEPLEKYIQTMSSEEFDSFVSNVERMEKVDDGVEYAFVINPKPAVQSGKIKFFEGILKTVNLKIEQRLGSEYVEITENEKPQSYQKSSIDSIFSSLWKEYPKKEEPEENLQSRKSAFLDKLDNYRE